MKMIVLAFSVLLATGAICGSAMAAEYAPTTSVSYAGLDLATSRDAQTLLNRLSNASLEACGAFKESLPDYRWAIQRSACYQSKMNEAVRGVHSRVLDQLYSRDGDMYLASK